MRRSQRKLLFVLLAALLVALALPLTAAAGEQSPSRAVFGGEGPPSTQALEGDSSSGSGSDAGSDDASISQSSDSGSSHSRSHSSSDDRNCSDFSSQEDAQSTYVNQNGDPYNLDDDNDGSACETYHYGDEEDFDEVEFTDASFDEYPREGIASGGGSTANNVPSLLPLLVSAGAFGLLAAGSGVLTLRRRLGR
jgi:hypothetical protein